MCDKIEQQQPEAPGTELLILQDHLALPRYKYVTRGQDRVLLVPQPSLDDQNDPLLWPRWKKWLTFSNGLVYTFLGSVTGPMMAGGMQPDTILPSLLKTKPPNLLCRNDPARNFLQTTRLRYCIQ